MIYITGDKHGNFDSIEDFCSRNNTTKDDVLIVLGDLGVNYYGGRRDRSRKRYLNDMPITVMAVRGNHERRPDPSWNIRTITNDSYFGTFIIEPGYDSILYMQDGHMYWLNTSSGWNDAFVIGGAYSVDKYYRLGCFAAGNTNMLWFEDEQLSPVEMNAVKNNLLKHIALRRENSAADDAVLSPHYILSHTCPLSMEPVDMFLPQVDQSTVDQSTEIFLDDIRKTLEDQRVAYEKWFCGHWHTDRTSQDKFRFVFHDFIAL